MTKTTAMGAFKSIQTFFVSPALIPMIARDLTTAFREEEYEVHSEELISGGYDISITKGGVFKAILGMKSALKITIAPDKGAVRIEAGVGIFGQQAIPTVISMLFFWPVLITQISGMISQAKLDDKVMAIAAATIERETQRQTVSAGDSTWIKFCTNCGNKMDREAVFCSACGTKSDSFS